MTKDEIIQVESQLIEGIKTSDTDLLDRLLHDELLFIAPNGETVTKEADLASHRKGEMEVEHLEARFEDVRIVDDNAIVVVVYDTRGRMLGKAIQGKFRYIRVWKKFNAGWKVIGGSCFAI